MEERSEQIDPECIISLDADQNQPQLQFVEDGSNHSPDPILDDTYDFGATKGRGKSQEVSPQRSLGLK